MTITNETIKIKIKLKYNKKSRRNLVFLMVLCDGAKQQSKHRCTLKALNQPQSSRPTACIQKKQKQKNQEH